MIDRASTADALNQALDGRYRIARMLGEGGMATVYLADDLRHGRQVALKVLRPELAAVVGADRFLSEIQTTAKLQHPHILPLFDSGEAGSFLFYVMPYIRGESLRERLDRERQLGVDEAVTIARRVASALAHAHRDGVVHRDVKPANILVSDQGDPLVADFGIALALAQAGEGRLTETGLSLGTPHYMSPEQAAGDHTVDQRSDVYALGCVLYEMLAGQPPFTAPTAQAVLAQILTVDPPPVTRIRRTVPPHVAAALARALEKLPADRFPTSAEFADALADPTFRYQARHPGGPDRGRDAERGAGGAGSARWALPAAVVVAVLALALAAWSWLATDRAEPAVTRARVDLESRTAFTSLGDVLVSPDGRRFAVAGLSGGAPLLWRNADDERFRTVPGTERVEYAAFSPDGESIAFGTVDAGAVLRVHLAGGAPQSVAATATPDVGGLDWGDDGTIVYTHSQGVGLFAVPASGGEPERLLPDSVRIRNPKVLPGGRAVLFTHRGTQSTHVLDRSTGQVRLVRAGAVDAAYSRSGHLLYTDPSGTLWAAPFDARRAEVTGAPVRVFDGLARPAPEYARFAVSHNGTLVYSAGPNSLFSEDSHSASVVYLDGTSERLDVAIGEAEFGVAWSPDGGSIVYSSSARGEDQPNIWIYDVEAGTEPRQLTFEGDNQWPIFSWDGAQVIFSSEREGSDGLDLYVKTRNDDTPARLFLAHPGDQVATHWPRSDLLLMESGPRPGLAISVVDLSDPDSARVHDYLRPSAGQIWLPLLSPSGRHLLYSTEVGDRSQILLRSFPVPGTPTRVSDGGWAGQWSPDGRTVFYWTLGPEPGPLRTFVAARLALEPTPGVLSRQDLFTGLYDNAQFALHPDGDRLIVLHDTPRETSDELERVVVVTNWFSELRDKLRR